MRILYFLPFLLLASCFSEEKVDIGNTSTFIRYYNGGYNDQPVTISKTTDSGYIILSNTELRDGRFKIKLIKTDDQGNTLWTKLYPDFNTLSSRRAYGLLVLDDGSYVLTGEDININTNQSQAMVMTVGSDGTKASEKIYSFSGSVRGKAISLNTKNGSTGYIMLGEVDNNDNNMVVAEINKNNLNQEWVRYYGSGRSNLTNKLFLDARGNVFFGGTVTRDKSDIRLVKTIQDSQNTDFDLPIGNPAFNESGNDICRYGYGFAVIGTTNEKDGVEGELGIYFQRLAENGSAIGAPIIFSAVTSSGIEVPGNKEGNALAVTQDGGLLLAATVSSNESLNFGRNGKDLYLIKVDAFGTIMWQKDIGSRNDDRSVAVLQADDGGYIILASTTLAGLNTVMLLKTDKNGNIQ